MAQELYIQPASLTRKGIYYRKINKNGSEAVFQQVTFLSYRPHPAEILIHDGEKPRVIHRRCVYVLTADQEDLGGNQ